MARRISEEPIETVFTVTESAANTYTNVEIELPVAIISSSKLQGVELFHMEYEFDQPDVEPGQTNNRVRVEFTRDSETSFQGLASRKNLFADESRANREDATAVEQNVQTHSNTRLKKWTRMVDGTEIGKLVAERSIYAAVLGVGNAAAKTFRGKLQYHLVEMAASEILMQLALDEDF